MVETRLDPTIAPVLARTGDERSVLESFLDFHRAVVLRKLRGVSETDATHRLLPSATTLTGQPRRTAPSSALSAVDPAPAR